MKNGKRKSTGNGSSGGLNPAAVKLAVGKLRNRKSGTSGNGASVGVEPAITGTSSAVGNGKLQSEGNVVIARSNAEPSGNGVERVPGSSEGSGNGIGSGTGSDRGNTATGTAAAAGTGASPGTESLGADRGQAQFNLNPEPPPKRQRKSKAKADEEKSLAEVQAEIATLSGMLGAVLNASFYAVSLSQGEHWRLQPDETFQLSTGMTLAIKSSFPESWLAQYEKALSTYAPWVSVIITASSIINKRIEQGRIIAAQGQGGVNPSGVN